MTPAHYTAEDKARIIAQYPEHERATRTRGVPAMGSGRVFVVDEEKLLVEPFECPSHWVKLGGMDFGYDHPAAFVELGGIGTLMSSIWSAPCAYGTRRRYSTSRPSGIGAYVGPGRTTAGNRHSPAPACR